MRWQELRICAKVISYTTLQRDINLMITNKCSNNNHKLYINKIRLFFCVCFKSNQRKSNPHGILPCMHRDCIE